MRVFVESNFVLELAHQQEQYKACEQILGLARAKAIRLSVPAFALFEPYTTLERRQKERRELSDKVKAMVRELSRSEPLAEAARQNELGALLVDSIDFAAKAFASARESLLNHAEILALEAQTFRDASDWTDQLSLPDALVFASVFRALETGTGPACFITRNSKDFNDPLIKTVLEKHNCDLLFSFEVGLGVVNRRLRVETDSC